jgi:hypothetical protein
MHLFTTGNYRRGMMIMAPVNSVDDLPTRIINVKSMRCALDQLAETLNGLSFDEITKEDAQIVTADFLAKCYAAQHTNCSKDAEFAIYYAAALLQVAYQGTGPIQSNNLTR